MQPISLITCLLYLLTPVARSCHLRGKLTFSKTQLLMVSFLTLGLHGWCLYHWIDPYTGQDLNPANVFSGVTWFMAFTLSMVAIWRPLENLLLAILPLAASSIAIVIAQPPPVAPQVADITPAHVGHILVSLISLSLITMAGIQAVLLAFQTYCLKHPVWHRLLNWFPPLETMEQWLFQIIGIGFLVLSLCILGAICYFQSTALMAHLPKLIFSVAAWLVFAALLWGRKRAGWRGPLAVSSTIVGMTFLLFAYFGSKLWIPYP